MAWVLRLLKLLAVAAGCGLLISAGVVVVVIGVSVVLALGLVWLLLAGEPQWI